MIICQKCHQPADVSDDNVEQTGTDAESVKWQHIKCPEDKK
jgi:hypothetical protein